MKLSVIITAYDKHDITVAHVRESMNSTRVPDEIIVVNDGGSPDLLDKLKTLKTNTKVIYARIEQDIPWNYPGACNLGAYISTGDLITFEDNDNIPTPTWYEEAIKYLKDYPEIGRVVGMKRYHIDSKDLYKPAKEWKITGSRGPNQGTSMMYRKIYLELKGRDERFSGRYGWMYYDWRRRLLNEAKIRFGGVGQFYFVVDGQSDISRRIHPMNYRIYRRNALDKVKQPPQGILNFTYTIDYL